MGGPRPRPARAAWWGVGLLVLFVAWTGLSLAWTIAPERTWTDFNRVVAYALIATLGVLAGAGIPRAFARFAAGFLAIVSVVALYALAGKLAPGVLDDTEQVARLRAPLEYWNALGLLCVLAAPIAVRLAADATRTARARLLALEALYLLAIVIGLTYSRGAVAAFLVAAIVLAAFGRGRLGGVVAIGAALLAAAAPLAFAFTREALTENGAPLGDRIAAGRILGVLVLAAAGALLLGGRALLRAEPRVRVERTTRFGRVAIVAAGVLALAGAGGLAASERGFSGTISETVENFTEVKEDRQYDPVRLLSTNSGNRVSWWKEAAGAWSDRPLHGWGAGSFSLLHLRYRKDTLPVTQAHSMPMQLLAETGIVGLLLAYGAVLALLAAAIARTRSMEGEDRGLAIALLAACGAWLLHGLYDWDFQIPAVTAPVLFMLGLLAGHAGAPRGPEAPALAAVEPPPMEARAPLVGLATILAAAVVVSAGLPWLAAHKADRAAEISAARTPEALQDAAAEADLAARLNPLSVRPLFVAAAVAAARDRDLEARAHLLEAADRAPDDPQVWGRLAGLALGLADRQGYLRATQRVFELDPLNPIAGRRLETALQVLAPPASSATSTGTPLVQP